MQLCSNQTGVSGRRVASGCLRPRWRAGLPNCRWATSPAHSKPSAAHDALVRSCTLYAVAAGKPAQCIDAGPSDAAPDYTSVDARPLNQTVMKLFRQKMVAALGEDTEEEGYDGVIALTRRLNAKFDTRETQVRTVAILHSLFPAWLPGMFGAMFAGPLPTFSAQLNAYVTALTCEWLMGDLQVNDVTLDDGTVLENAGVKIERCRFLEASGCASICINNCKVPTQEFLLDRMGVPLRMTPNYEDFSCQFDFGKAPLPQTEDDAFSTPCFSQCPSKAVSQTGACSKVKAMEEMFAFQGM